MHLGRDVTLYVCARLGMVAAVTAGLVLLNVPLLVALAVGVVVALPLDRAETSTTADEPLPPLVPSPT